jgi:hypothetical protein
MASESLEEYLDIHFNGDRLTSAAEYVIPLKFSRRTSAPPSHTMMPQGPS